MRISSNSTITLDPAPERGYWTNGDIVKGLVNVELKTEGQDAAIEIQLRCEDRGRLYKQDGEGVVDFSAVPFKDTKVLWTSEPFDISKVSVGGSSSGNTSNSSTVQPQIPFQFTIPNDMESLPSSWNIEPGHDDNGIFWGVFATVEGKTIFAEIRLLPHRWREFNGEDEEFVSTTHSVILKMLRRPSILVKMAGSDVASKSTTFVEGRLAVPKSGLAQVREVPKEQLPEIRVAVRTPDANVVMVKDIIIFMDTMIATSVQGHHRDFETVSIVILRQCEELLVGGSDWQDLTQLVHPACIYGLPESGSTDMHSTKHAVRVQITTCPVGKSSRSTIIELKMPVILQSEATTTSSLLPGPPAYQTSHS